MTRRGLPNIARGDIEHAELVTSLLKRFWNKTKIEGDCVVWTSARHPDGYGKFFADGKIVIASRWIYEQLVGEIDGLLVLHRCDNPPCVKIEHLYAGTEQQNHDDAVARNRVVFGERHPDAKLTARDVIDIRAARDAGETTTSLAKRFSITAKYASKITRGSGRRRG